MQSTPNLKIIRLKEMLEIISISKSSVYSKMDKSSKQYDPNFPKQVSLGERAVGWYLEDVLSWLNGLKK